MWKKNIQSLALKKIAVQKMKIMLCLSLGFLLNWYIVLTVIILVVRLIVFYKQMQVQLDGRNRVEMLMACLKAIIQLHMKKIAIPYG